MRSKLIQAKINYTAKLGYWPEGAEFAIRYPKERHVRIVNRVAVDIDTGEILRVLRSGGARWVREEADHV